MATKKTKAVKPEPKKIRFTHGFLLKDTTSNEVSASREIEIQLTDDDKFYVAIRSTPIEGGRRRETRFSLSVISMNLLAEAFWSAMHDMERFKLPDVLQK